MSQNIQMDETMGGRLTMSQNDTAKFTPLTVDDSSIINLDPKYLYSFYLASNYYPKHTKETNARKRKKLLENEDDYFDTFLPSLLG